MTNAKTTPNGNGKPVSAAEPCKVQYQECGDGLYLPDFRVRMPDGRVYSIADIRRQGDPDDYLRRLFDEVEPAWDMDDAELPAAADVQFITLPTFLKDLIFRYKRENISMAALSGTRLQFYLDDEMLLEVSGFNMADMLAYAMKLERENK